MTPVLATRLAITSVDTPPHDLFDQVVDECKNWLVDRGRRFGLAVDKTQAQYRVHGLENQKDPPRVSWNELTSDEVQAWQASLVHSVDRASDPSEQFSLRVDMVARLDGPEVVVTIQNLLMARFDRISPPGFVMQVPGVVGNLIRRFPYVSGGETSIKDYAVDLKNDKDVERLVGKILDRSRGLPIIVVSPEADGKMFFDPNVLAHRTVSLARVYVLPRLDAGGRALWILNERLGSERSTSPGSVRLYWPGFRQTDSHHRHPRWTDAMLADFDQRGVQLSDEILRHLTTASAIGISPDASVVSLERENAQRRLRHAQLRVQEAENESRRTSQSHAALLQNIAALEATGEEYKELVTLGDEERAQLLVRIEECETREYQLNAQLLSERARPVNPSDSLTHIQRVKNARCFQDLLRLATELAPPDAIQFLDTCIAGAASTPFEDQLEDCWLGLHTVIQAATLFHNNPSMGVQEAAKTAGATMDQFKSDVSDTARKMYESDYRVTFMDANGKHRKEYLGPHLKYGKGNKDKTPYIYWFVDESTRQFVVGHAGGKLRDGTGGYARR